MTTPSPDARLSGSTDAPSDVSDLSAPEISSPRARIRAGVALQMPCHDTMLKFHTLYTLVGFADE